MKKSQNNDEQPVCKGSSERTGSYSQRCSLVVGLTGGIASGKSTVAQMFEALGACVISADDIVHELMIPGTEVYSSLLREFGEGILELGGAIDRRRLAQEVFSDATKRARLEKITHPPVLRRLSEEARRFHREGRGVLILEIPLLIETGSSGMVDKVIVVYAEQETQIERLKLRYNLTREEAVLRVASQLPVEEKLKYADWVIRTECSLQHTKEQVTNVWRSIQKITCAPRIVVL